MRWVRFETDNQIFQGSLGIDGEVEIYDAPFFLGGRPTGARAPLGRILPPVEPPNIFAIGRNYGAHAAETGATLSRWPVVFMKPTTALVPDQGEIRLPASAQHGPEVDFEVEMAVVIGKKCRDIPQSEALSVVAGYTIANDVSARRWQKNAGGGQWIRGKGFDGFCPLGPHLITADEIADPQALALGTTLNGVEMQRASTAEMLFPVAQLIAFLSQDTTLLPGTLILTGTPEGVGFARNPQIFLAEGDIVEVWVEGIGSMRNPVAGPR